MKSRKKPAPKEKKARPKAKSTEKKPSRTISHPLYGEIPLIPQETHYAGKIHTYWTYDTSYQPPLPSGAIRGNISKQIYCSACHTPKYFYQDISKTCVQCKQVFTFHAKEQKYWYETLQFNFHSTAIRCLKCRRQKRTGKALQTQLSQASSQVLESPKDPLVHLNYASSLIQYYEYFKAGNLEKAIAACRQVRRLSKTLPESYFWEAKALELLSLSHKALKTYQTFIEQSPAKPRRLIQQAQMYIENTLSKS